MPLQVQTTLLFAAPVTRIRMSAPLADSVTSHPACDSPTVVTPPEDTPVPFDFADFYNNLPEA